jgi:hypothetical protein
MGVIIAVVGVCASVFGDKYRSVLWRRRLVTDYMRQESNTNNLPQMQSFAREPARIAPIYVSRY